jgi:hypothetical protein
MNINMCFIFKQFFEERIQHLVSYRVHQDRVGQRSGWHENLQNLLTRPAIREEPLSDLQQRMEDFTSYHATALPQSDLTLGTLALLQFCRKLPKTGKLRLARH